MELRSWDILEEINATQSERELVATFIGSYLEPKTEKQMKTFNREMKKRPRKQQDQVNELMTCWERQGLEQGVELGKRELLLKLLNKRFGPLDDDSVARIGLLNIETLEKLGEDFLDFKSISDLKAWLNSTS